jgi:4-hydroxy-3-methylbut-2-enyl diphosphate reductase
VTAGASAPESLVKKVIERLRELGAGKIEEMPGELETVEFKLPSELGAA